MNYNERCEKSFWKIMHMHLMTFSLYGFASNILFNFFF